jgi:hypothetical protein
VATRLAWMSCPGNHERDWPGSKSLFNGLDSGGECGVSYSTRLQMPRPSFDDTWWSRDIGAVHYLSISTEHSFAPGSSQYDFIERDLRQVTRGYTPWVIVGGHRPMYISSTNTAPVDGDQTVAALLRQHLEPLFAKVFITTIISSLLHVTNDPNKIVSSGCRIFWSSSFLSAYMSSV